MIDEKELRIGNLINKGEHEAIDVSLQTFYNIYYQKNGYDSYVPIPLAEEWLLKFGFKKGGNAYFYLDSPEFGGDFLRVDLKDGYIFVCELNLCHWKNYSKNWHSHIKHVHQLQNLYFALTGEELKLKQ